MLSARPASVCSLVVTPRRNCGTPAAGVVSTSITRGQRVRAREVPMRVRAVTASVALVVLGAGDLFGALSAYAQSPPPPRTVPSIGLKTPDPTTLSPGSVPGVGLRTPDPTTLSPGSIPSVGPKTPDPTTAFPSAVPSVGIRSPDPTTISPGSVPSVGPKAPDPTTLFPGVVPSLGPRTPDPMTAPGTR
jgi:hypothetical protein